MKTMDTLMINSRCSSCLSKSDCITCHSTTVPSPDILIAKCFCESNYFQKDNTTCIKCP